MVAETNVNVKVGEEELTKQLSPKKKTEEESVCVWEREVWVDLISNFEFQIPMWEREFQRWFGEIGMEWKRVICVNVGNCHPSIRL